MQHEDRNHRRIWGCRFHSDLHFLTEESLEQHLQQEHYLDMTIDQRPEFASISQFVVDDARERCPVCLELTIEIPDFMSHLANHMERIASFALPCHGDVDEETADVASDRAISRSISESYQHDSHTSSSIVLVESIASEGNQVDKPIPRQQDVLRWLPFQSFCDAPQPDNIRPDTLSLDRFLSGHQFRAWYQKGSIWKLYCCGSEPARLV